VQYYHFYLVLLINQWYLSVLKNCIFRCNSYWKICTLVIFYTGPLFIIYTDVIIIIIQFGFHNFVSIYYYRIINNNIWKLTVAVFYQKLSPSRNENLIVMEILVWFKIINLLFSHLCLIKYNWNKFWGFKRLFCVFTHMGSFSGEDSLLWWYLQTNDIKDNDSK
jgi:hypothetical protein